ncbi:LuxR family transcriptional regulator [Erythrobacter sp. THAF29]|uniref:helix-turn-helix transcriptional regulator n=1 Tax=Erythrobacter sp. THAF29 TaxID=2587851 RepID=UPI0012690C59|nr:LuxR family transcriptional regulator [Erythrobacter sp. THAF29]QFT77823.1 Transcriptional activator protein TraR [Erythrobacter sp. THAF29]
MQQHFETIESIEDLGEVLWYAVGVCEDLGAIRQSYHFTPLFQRQNSERTVVHAHGFDPEWIKIYEESDFRKKDPIPPRTMAHGRLLTWKDAQTIAPNTPDNEEYFAAMKEFGLVHGFGLPLFGPRSRNAYASIDFDRPLEEVDKTIIGNVRMISQAAHQRVCVLLEAEREPIELSRRELEVLSWIVKGKSLSVIADILGLSPDTVKTYAKRIYAKLDANDRVGAVVKALKLGLVTA